MNTSRQCIEDVGKLKMYSPLFIGSCKTASCGSGGGAEVGGGGATSHHKTLASSRCRWRVESVIVCHQPPFRTGAWTIKVFYKIGRHLSRIQQ